MDDRISFITHQGQDIMLIDFRNCSPKEMLLLLDEVQHTVAVHPRNSLLTLGDMTGTHMDRAAATRMKEVLVLDRPYVRRAAWVGTDLVPKVYLDNFKSFSQRRFAYFETREQAMDWLVKEDEAAE